MENCNENLVVEMYVEHKLSMAQISEKLKISASKVGRILKKHGVQSRSISDAITNLFITKFNKKPFQMKEKLSVEDLDLKISGIMLYWGEGAKRGTSVNFCNSNPEMIQVFLRFLREICGVDEDRIKILIHLYLDQEYQSLQEFWMLATGIKQSNFYRPYIHTGKTGTYKNKSVYGTASISYADVRLLRTILQWIEEYKNSILKVMPA